MSGSGRAVAARGSVVMYPVVAVLLLTVLVALIGSLPATGPWGFAAIAIIVAALVVPWTQAE